MGWLFMAGGAFAILDAFDHEGDSLTQKDQWQIGVALVVILIGALYSIFGDD